MSAMRAPARQTRLLRGQKAQQRRGAHTEEVLRDVLGYGPDKLRELLDSGAFSSSNP